MHVKTKDKTGMEGIDKNILGHHRKWAILCPGPSLMNVSFCDVDLRDTTIVSVNGALFSELGRYSRYWSMLDPEVFKSACEHYRIEKFNSTEIWTHANFIGPAKEILKYQDYKELIKFPIKTWEYMGEYGQSSMFCAVKLAAMSGAKEITLYGADMSGQGYYNAGFENSRTRHNDKRWNDERELFKKIRLELKQFDITLKREFVSDEI